MKPKILLTSFQTWLPHQKSNSADDLLVEIQKLDYSPYVSLFFLRNLPVNTESASQKVIAEIEIIQPDVVMCCGMAEKRNTLTIESNAFDRDEYLYTSIDLAQLTRDLIVTKVSHNAGKFVCEGLYYQVLKYIQSQGKNLHCIFIHVPVLEPDRLSLILGDCYSLFFLFAYRLAQLTNIKNVNKSEQSIS